jgi:BolA protein
MTNIDCITLIKKKLTDALTPIYLEINDNSDKHSGHAGIQEGQKHCSITIVSSIFNGKTLIQRHRLVYAVLDELMKTEIHALSINTLTPDEFQID